MRDHFHLLGIPKEKFARNWLKILPLYTHCPLPRDEFVALTSHLKLSGNEHLLDNVPPI